MINPYIYRRRQLLPWWMKLFIWIFMILGFSSVASRFLQLFGIYFGIDAPKTIYGLETYEQFSVLSLFITALLIFKGITAFGLWTEQKWAIKFAIIDALTGTLICIMMMFLAPLFTMIDGVYELNYRFELLLLIPYLVHCFRIKNKWEHFTIINPYSTPARQYEEEIPVIEEKVEEVTEEHKPEIVVEDKEDPRRFMPKHLPYDNTNDN